MRTSFLVFLTTTTLFCPVSSASADQLQPQRPTLSGRSDAQQPVAPASLQNAQAAQVPQQRQSGGSGLEDIVVTARKRAESLQDAPLSISAMSQQQIERSDISSIEKLAGRMPELNVARAGPGGSGAQIALRGISSSSTSVGIEQSVATVVDGAYYGQGRFIEEGLFDLERIEVLKGPQALFFGKNATAGLISITTADPGSTPEVSATARYEFRSSQVQGELVASTPLTDRLGVRLALHGTKMYGGYFKNVSVTRTYVTTDLATGAQTTHTAPPADSKTPGGWDLFGRGTLKWEATDQFTATLKTSFSVNSANNPSWNLVAFNCVDGTSQANGFPCEKKFVQHLNNLPEAISSSMPLGKDDGSLYNKYKSFTTTLNLNYETDNFTVTSISNFNRFSNRFACWCDLQSNPNAAVFVTEETKWRAASSELRMLSAFDSPLNFMIGGMVQTTKLNFFEPLMLALVEDTTAAPENRYLSFIKQTQSKGKTYAVFGQLIWSPLEQVEITAGGRYTYETKDSSLTQPYVNASLRSIFRPTDSPDGLGTITADQKFEEFSPEVSASWKPAEDILLYASYKGGYKSGGFSASTNNSVLTSPSEVVFGPETVRGWEGGIKSTLFDNQVRAGLGLYTYKYQNLQVDIFNTQTISNTTLTGDARTKGVELSLEYAPIAVSGLNFRGSLNYNEAKYIEFIGACYSGQTPLQGCNLQFNKATNGFMRQDLAGAPLALAPRWTGSLGASYMWTLFNGITADFSVDAKYSGSYLASAFNNPASRQSRYASIDAVLSFASPDERYHFAIIGKNLTNRFILGGVTDAPNTGGGTGTPAGIRSDQIGYVGLPRTVQVQLKAKF